MGPLRPRPSLLRTRICPTCGARALVVHCVAKGCTWATCKVCHSWGEESFRRWVDARSKEAS